MGWQRLGRLSSGLDAEHGAGGGTHSHCRIDLGNRAVCAAQDSTQSIDFRMVAGPVFVSDVRFDGFFPSADGNFTGQPQSVLGIPQHDGHAQLVLRQTDLSQYRDADAGGIFAAAGKGKALFCSNAVVWIFLLIIYRSDAIRFSLRHV